MFNPTLRSRGSPKLNSIKLSKDKRFISQMKNLFNGVPSGYIVFYNPKVQHLMRTQ